MENTVFLRRVATEWVPKRSLYYLDTWAKKRGHSREYAKYPPLWASEKRTAIIPCILNAGNSFLKRKWDWIFASSRARCSQDYAEYSDNAKENPVGSAHNQEQRAYGWMGPVGGMITAFRWMTLRIASSNNPLQICLGLYTSCEWVKSGEIDACCTTAFMRWP